MFNEVKPEIADFIEESRKQRNERRDAKARSVSAVVIQKNWRSFLIRKKIIQRFRSEFDSKIFGRNECKPTQFVPAIELLRYVKCLKFQYNPTSDYERFQVLIRYIVSSVETNDSKVSYISLALRKPTLVEWIVITKWLFTTVVQNMGSLDPSIPSDSKVLNIYLSFLLVHSNCCQWPLVHDEKLKPAMSRLGSTFLQHLVQKRLFEHLNAILQKGLARHTPALTKVSLTGVFTIAMRPLIYENFPQRLVISFTVNILTIPGFILHINSMMNEAYDIIMNERLCSKIILTLYSSSEEFDNVLSKLDGSYVLCLIANLVQLSLLETDILASHCTEFCVVLSKFMHYLGTYVGNKKSNHCSWHPILGWFAQSLDNSLQSAMSFVTSQLRLLWNGRMVRLLFADLYAQAELNLPEVNASDAGSCSTSHISPIKTTPTMNQHGPGVPSKAEKLAVLGLLPPISRRRSKSSGSDVDGYGYRVRHGLSSFLRQITNSSAHSARFRNKKERTNNYIPNLSTRHPDSPGPSDLPKSLKAVCMLYCFTSGSLKEIRSAILAGLSLGDLLPRMWRLISCCGSVRDWANVIINSQAVYYLEPHESHLMQIFASATSNLLSILDDAELFELKKSFTVDELCSMGSFFNHLIYESVIMVPDPNQLKLWSPSCKDDNKLNKTNESITAISNSGNKSAVHSTNPPTTMPNLFTVCLRLLSVIYERDSRHLFTPPDFWLISNLKVSAFLADLRKPKPHASFLLKHIPHIIPHKERVILFRDFVRDDKASLGIHTRTNWLTDDGPVGAVITVHRNRIVEDGYQQLANLTSPQLRMKIRVQFVNEMGLDEVGIDLDGVFKEFLEETLRRVFDPSLNLFRVTNDQRLYPSPTSHLQESHLQLFEFLGKMLAKAIYECIVVDVPFANFFLTQLLGREKAGCYSFLDELATLDRELYKSLSYIKHYDGDVSDLEFTYSYAEDCLGQVIIHDLCPGGRQISVTNDVKISYVHSVAHFRMYKQIRAQTASFIRGFYSILNPDWLAMFSPPELQTLISGDSGSMNIDDLKQHTRYSGGFHSNHRVIRWLWDILRRDFDDRERGLFLKFVTSCSRPPLLGFGNLEPPFCIRCVHYTNEDHDVGDTLGSVLKGFLGVVGRREEVSRLPTASTCFNLLKLPNYSSRSTLKEKLRYAINSHAGFELS
ncbi:Ubiquitin-protein ligase E3B [Schistosoma japonicum]|nr:Ubiquitin-protein ligase E3B [Schistosoma japonicum]